MCKLRIFSVACVCLCCVHCAQSDTPAPTTDGNDFDAGNGTKRHVHIHGTRNVTSTGADIGTAESDYFVSALFQKYSGNDQKLSLDGFTRLLCQLNLMSASEADDKGIDEKRVQSVRSCENVTFAGHLASLDTHSGSHKDDVQYQEHTDGHDHDHVDDHDHHDHQPNRNADGGNGFGTHQQGSHTPSSKRRRRRATEPTTTHVHTDHMDECVNPKDLLEYFHISSNNLQASDFRLLCPALIYKLDQNTCRDHHHDDHNHIHQEGEEMVEEASSFNEIPGKVWGFSIVAVIIISLVGLLGVAVIPIMQKVFYNHLLQLLVALAVGALSGDALLHLLPHALGKNLSHGAHDHEHGAEDNHLEAVWMGLVALLCIFFFFLIERILTIVTDSKRRKKAMGRKKKKHCERLCDIENSGAVGAKLSAYDEGDYLNCDQMVMVVHPNKALKAYADAAHDVVMHQCDETLSHVAGPLETDPDNSLDGHVHTHGHTHGHAHGHAHCDTMPGSVAAVAWMVILGDGIHNFSDGLAIGAAFASSITGGVSTSIAVFCHELPHEIGDFAVLLRAGMSVKQAVVYNCVSSILCFIGMLIGVAIGNIHSATLWIFAGVGGMFLYISMVDMLPEMSAVDTKKGENQFLHLFLQVCGMVFGASIMLVIAVFEHDLQQVLG